MYKYKKIKIGKNRTRDEHRIVAEKKIGRPLRPNEVVHHKNNDPRDNRPENLQVMTAAAHVRLHQKKGEMLSGHIPTQVEVRRLQKRYRGEGNVNAKLTEAQVREMKRLMAANKKPADVAKKFGVKTWTAYAIREGLRWGHVTI